MSDLSSHGRSVILFLFMTAAAAAPGLTHAVDCDAQPTGNGAIFYHPDGTSAGHWDLARILYYGPDGSLNWDRLPQMAAYRGHLRDSLTSSSNGGASTPRDRHARLEGFVRA